MCLSILISIKHRYAYKKKAFWVTLNFEPEGGKRDKKADKHSANHLFFVCIEHLYHLCMFECLCLFFCLLCRHVDLNSSRNVLDLAMVKNAFICARSGSLPQGWRYSHFSSYVSLVPASTIHPPKISRI